MQGQQLYLTAGWAAGSIPCSSAAVRWALKLSGFSGQATWLHGTGVYIQLLDKAANLLPCPAGC